MQDGCQADLGAAPWKPNVKPVFTVHCSAPGMRNAVIRSEKRMTKSKLWASLGLEADGCELWASPPSKAVCL